LWNLESVALIIWIRRVMLSDLPGVGIEEAAVCATVGYSLQFSFMVICISWRIAVTWLIFNPHALQDSGIA
jgi:hypothetical protein